MEEPARMFIDTRPPVNPETGDVWIRFGEWRTWNGGWDPPWEPEREVMPLWYPKPGRRKKIKAVGMP